MLVMFTVIFYLLSKPTPVGVEALPLLVLVYVTDTVVGALWLLKDFSNVNFRCNILLTQTILTGFSPHCLYLSAKYLVFNQHQQSSRRAQAH